jgi:hypothetical protein
VTGAGRDRPPPRPARLAANRRNALRSTGPKSPTGKRRAARNALKHGLAVPVRADPSLRERVEALSSLIAGEGASATRRALARRVAEAQVDLDRVRAARFALLARGVGGGTWDLAGTRPRAPDPGPAAPAAPGDRPAAKRGETPPCARSGLRLAVAPRPADAVLHDVARWLAGLERYEARALSRRRSAIRALDAAWIERAGGAREPQSGRFGTTKPNSAKPLFLLDV